MKHIIISTAIILFCSFNAQAYSINGYGFKIGVVRSCQDFDYTTAWFDDLDLYSYRTGFNFGVFIECFDFPTFSLLIEAHYIQKGMKIDEILCVTITGELDSIRTFDYRVDYLSIPILPKLIIKYKYISPYLIIGPRFDFLIGYKIEDVNDVVYKNLENFIFGGDIGAGIEISISNFLTSLLEFRYSLDFKNAYKTDLLKVKNKSYEILFGLKF